ncbi:hypothetical protein [Paraburkholderia sediminicola]|uniref:hypothetical protein n=1 Tax=Paraburkholderia sediminicola TaxID=458836 RepID=UPI0038BBC07F
MNHQNGAVVDLEAYRRQRIPESNTKHEAQEDPHHVANELAYYLLKAIQAVKKLPH